MKQYEFHISDETATEKGDSQLLSIPRAAAWEIIEDLLSQLRDTDDSCTDLGLNLDGTVHVYEDEG